MAKKKVTVKVTDRRGVDTVEEPVKPITFRPIGPRVLVMFEQSDWVVGDGGLILKTGIKEAGFRMDGKVVAVGTKDIPEGVGVGSTVYADPRLGEVIKLEGTRYHIMRCDDLIAVAVLEEK